MRLLAVPVLLSLVTVSPAGAAQQERPALTVQGEVSAPLTLTIADLDALPRATVTTDDNGIATTWEGVWISEVLKKAGMPLGSSMRGQAVSYYVVASASDGYRVVFSLAELDPEMTDGQYLLAYRANGNPLFGEHGDFRLVIPTDKRGPRALRMLTALTIHRARD